MTTPTLQEQIEWLETQVRWAEAEADTPTALRLDAILSQLRRIEAAEKEMPPYPPRKTFEYVEGIAVAESEHQCHWNDYDRLRDYALVQKAKLAEAEKEISLLRAALANAIDTAMKKEDK